MIVQGQAEHQLPTVVVKSIDTAGCVKQNGQLLTFAKNNLVGSDCRETTHVTGRVLLSTHYTLSALAS